jgi:cytochrome c oxidase subunit 2
VSLLPKRARVTLFGVLAVSTLLLSGCSNADMETWKRVAMPVPGTQEAPHTLHLWQWVWLAAMIVGVIVWGLIFFSAWHFRRRSDDEVPVQMRYHLPIEIFNTVAPVMMVIVVFFFTVQTQNKVFHDFEKPDTTITVVGQQWSWTFNYNLTHNPSYTPGINDPTPEYVPASTTLGADEVVHESGTTGQQPTLWLPLGKKVEFHLYSPDVIHSFWAVDFLMKLDVVPGRDNHFGVVPTRLGTFAGRCAELCGLYHSKMLFTVKVVTPQQYAAHIAELSKTASNRGPALGGNAVNLQPGYTGNSGGEQ